MGLSAENSYSFWQAFDTPKARNALDSLQMDLMSHGLKQSADIMTMLRTRLAASLLASSREHRQFIKTTIAAGNFDIIGNAPNISFLTINPGRPVSIRHRSGYYINTKNTEQVIISYPREMHPDCWIIESAFAAKIASLQSQGKLCHIAKPLTIDHIRPRIIWRQYLKNGQIAPTLNTIINSPALQVKLNY